MPVGQAAMQGASKQNRQREASTRASCGESGGLMSAIRSARAAASRRGWRGIGLAPFGQRKQWLRAARGSIGDAEGVVASRCHARDEAASARPEAAAAVGIW